MVRTFFRVPLERTDLDQRSAALFPSDEFHRGTPPPLRFAIAKVSLTLTIRVASLSGKTAGGLTTPDYGAFRFSLVSSSSCSFNAE